MDRGVGVTLGSLGGLTGTEPQTGPLHSRTVLHGMPTNYLFCLASIARIASIVIIVIIICPPPGICLLTISSTFLYLEVVLQHLNTYQALENSSARIGHFRGRREPSLRARICQHHVPPSRLELFAAPGGVPSNHRNFTPTQPQQLGHDVPP